MEIREIGIEKECFLIKKVDGKDTIMEPRLFGFPKDEFEFLVELRSLPSDRLYPVYTSLQQEELQYSLRANKFGMNLSKEPMMIVTNEWVDNLWNKYDLHRFDDKDFTKNIHGVNISHHFGVLPDIYGYSRLTAGIHVHFSSRDSETGEILNLPIEEIVCKMDNEFDSYIQDAGRIHGEWEPKPHGFEYRSLPANVDIYNVLKKSFEILREC